MDKLLVEERVCEIQLPRLTQRKVLEEIEGLGGRRSKLGLAMGVIGGPTTGTDDGDQEEEEEEEEEGRERYVSRSPSRSVSPAGLDQDQGQGRFVSKSPTPEDDEEERIEGDV